MWIFFSNFAALIVYVMKKLIYFCVFLSFLFAVASCSNDSTVGVPDKSSLQEDDLVGPIKRASVRKFYSWGEVQEIKEYNENGMKISSKTIYPESTLSYTYEYDKLNRLIKKTDDWANFVRGESKKRLTVITYSGDAKFSKEYDENNNLLEEEKTVYSFNKSGQLESEVVKVSEYDKVSHRLDSTYISKEYYYRYDDDKLKYEVEYEDGDHSDSICVEYDINGKEIRRKVFNGLVYSYVWDGDVKLKEVSSKYGRVDRIKSYDFKGRLIEEQCYGFSSCDYENHINAMFRCIYVSDDDFTEESYREMGSFDPYRTPAWYNCHMELTAKNHYICTRDLYGNITKKYLVQGSDKTLVESIEYEYFK